MKLRCSQVCIWGLVSLMGWFACAEEQSGLRDLLKQAQDAFDRGDLEQTDKLTARGLDLIEDPTGESLTASLYLLQGRVALQTGDLDRAHRVLTRAATLTDTEKVDAALAGEIAHDLGLCLARQGNFEASANHLGRAVELREGTLGPDHMRVADSLQALANVAMSMRRMDAAKESATRAVAIREKNLGVDHIDVSRAWFLLARVYRSAGDYESAEEELNRVLDAMNRQLGKDHPEIAEVYRELGSVHLMLGNPSRSVGAFRAAAYIEDQTLDSDNPARVKTLLQLGEAHVANDETMEAELNFREAKTIAAEKLGKNHISVGFAAYGLGQVYTLWRNDHEAAAAFQEALRVFETHPRTAGDMIRKCLIEIHRTWVRLERTEDLAALKPKLILFGITEDELQEPPERSKLLKKRMLEDIQ